MDLSRFPDEWQDAWNSHDLDYIRSHYADNITFRSRKAIPLTGTGEIHGKTQLRAYWSKALANQPDLHFTLRDIFHGHQMLTLTYTNHKAVLAAETLWFAPDGLVHTAAACHAT